MAIRYLCDRCKKLVKSTYENHINNATTNVFYITSSLSQEPYQDYLDLCEDCYKSFLNWWEHPTSE